jgi:hypothetical protein
MSRHRRVYEPAPADVVLELLRAARLEYRCHEHVGRWTARCPLCGELCLEIREHGDRGRVSLRCATGCDSDKVRQRLTHPERCHSCGAVDGLDEHLGQLAGELLAVGHAQQRLLRGALGVDDTADLKLAA